MLLNAHSPMNRGAWTFTSFISNEANFINLKWHINRIIQGAHFLFPQSNWLLNQELLIKDVQLHFKANHYFRINICEDFYWIYEKKREDKKDFLSVGISEFKKMENSLPSFLKLSQYVDGDQELIKKNEDQINREELIYFDENNFLTEAISSNVFIVTSDNIVKTPPVSSRVLDGVMRKKTLETLEKMQRSIKIGPIHRNECIKAKEIWLTNSVQGVRWVKAIINCENSLRHDLYQEIVHTQGRFGEKNESKNLKS